MRCMRITSCSKKVTDSPYSLQSVWPWRVMERKRALSASHISIYDATRIFTSWDLRRPVLSCCHWPGFQLPLCARALSQHRRMHHLHRQLHASTKSMQRKPDSPCHHILRQIPPHQTFPHLLLTYPILKLRSTQIAHLNLLRQEQSLHPAAQGKISSPFHLLPLSTWI